MAKQPYFALKRSKLALLFQLMIFGLISGLLWQICPLWLWLLLNILMLISFAMFLRRPRVMAVGQLDQQLWCCHASDSAQPYSIVLERVIDHELYMILRTAPSRASMVIWRDQVIQQDWKCLKRLAKLG
jgi:hypothetical protein